MTQTIRGLVHVLGYSAVQFGWNAIVLCTAVIARAVWT